MTKTSTDSFQDPTQNEALRRLLHDLSNTLTGLLMNAGLLSLGLRGNDRLRRYAEEVVQAGERSATLVKEARAMVSPAAEADGATGCLTDHCDSEVAPVKPNELLELPPVSRRTH